MQIPQPTQSSSEMTAFAFRADNDGLVPGPYTGTIEDALGAALLCMAPVFVDDSDSHGDQNKGSYLVTSVTEGAVTLINVTCLAR